ncbi:hypothetical protein [Nocardia neocaledoniensis]|uniref:hypothetical protein n=1 Tax=Nocardia neocaledoniensis TaxID=236511 RepID=UPI0024584FC0|nr:hypothetical protein [Nocardia neocaledoniensis]
MASELTLTPAERLLTIEEIERTFAEDTADRVVGKENLTRAISPMLGVAPL